MIVNIHYPYMSGGGNVATIVVTAPTGSTVTATLGDVVLTAVEKDGVWTFRTRKFGVWTITATLGSQTAQTTVDVTEAITYDVSIGYTFKVTMRFVNPPTTRAKVIIGNTTYQSGNRTITVNYGTVITLYTSSGSFSDTSRITINGTVVSNTVSETNYPITPNKDVTIVCTKSPNGNYGDIVVTY